MSRPGQPPAHVDPDRQIALLIDQYCTGIHPQTLARVTSRARELGLAFGADELCLLAALDTPARLQEFLNNQIYYNNDHASPDQEETCMPPRQVLRTARAHCFEGALLAYTVDYLHGHDPRLALLEAIQDSEHNLVVFRDPRTGLYGCNAHSAFPHLDGRPPVYKTVRALAETYALWYYSDRTHDPHDLTLAGYSEPFDLVAKFGVAWMSSETALWDMYYTYIDDTVTLHDLFDDSGRAHPYPLIRALQEGWIQVDGGGDGVGDGVGDGRGQPFVNVDNLPWEARRLWYAFWGAYEGGEAWLRPQGRARDIEQHFRRLTGTTPIDLVENAGDFVYFLERGYRVGQLLTRPGSIRRKRLTVYGLNGLPAKTRLSRYTHKEA